MQLSQFTGQGTLAPVQGSDTLSLRKPDLHEKHVLLEQLRQLEGQVTHELLARKNSFLHKVQVVLFEQFAQLTGHVTLVSFPEPVHGSAVLLFSLKKPDLHVSQMLFEQLKQF